MRHSLPLVLVLGLSAACSNVEHARVVPQRMDLVGHVKDLKYEGDLSSIGMERAWTATLFSPEFGGEEWEIRGRGSQQYKLVQQAQQKKGLVLVDCIDQVRTPCRVSALETLIDPPQAVPKSSSESSWPPDEPNAYQLDTPFAKYEQSGFSITQRLGQANASQCKKGQVKAWKQGVEELAQGERDWMSLYSHKERVIDADLDGVDDTFSVIATQYLRDCDFRENIPYKEIVVQLENGVNGKKKMWNWKGGLPDRFVITPKERKIVIQGRNMDGARWEKPLSY